MGGCRTVGARAGFSAPSNCHVHAAARDVLLSGDDPVRSRNQDRDTTLAPAARTWAGQGEAGCNARKFASPARRGQRIP
eukprot:4515133-Alexandrium_andersonii.AAC.1